MTYIPTTVKEDVNKSRKTSSYNVSVDRSFDTYGFIKNETFDPYVNIKRMYEMYQS